MRTFWAVKRAGLALLTALAAACAAATADSPTPPPPAVREIALTFDDSATPDSHTMTGVQRTRRLIAALDQADVEGAMFFVVGSTVVGEDRTRIEAFAAAGHTIANHSNTHRSGNTLDAEEYIADIRTADTTLRPMAGFRPFYRFPYLNAGDTIEKRDAYRAALREMGYQHGYVTADAWDWYMAGKVDEAVAAGREVDWGAVRDVYVDVVARSVEHYDAVARRYLGRSPRHVLLMHENDLAALYIGDVVARLRSQGWTIVSAERAFEDPISTVDPETLRLGGGQIVAMASVAGAPDDALNSGLTNGPALDALLAPAFGD